MVTADEILKAVTASKLSDWKPYLSKEEKEKDRRCAVCKEVKSFDKFRMKTITKKCKGEIKQYFWRGNRCIECERILRRARR